MASLLAGVQDRTADPDSKQVASQRLRTAYTTAFEHAIEDELLVAGRLAERTLPIDLFKKQFANQINKCAKRVADTEEAYAPWKPALPSVLSALLSDALREHLAEPQFRNYQRDLEVRREFSQKASVQACLVYLDETLAFNAKQRRRMTAYLKERWELGGLPAAYAVNSVGFRLRGKQVSAVMSEAQLAEWARQGANGLMISLDPEASPVQQTEELTARLQEAAALRNDWLIAELSLTPEQKQRLRVACKGAIQYVVKEHIAAHKTFADASRPGQPRSDVPFKTRWMVKSTPGDLLLSHSKWHRLARTVLTKEQRADFDQLFAERRHRVHSGKCYSLISGYGEISGLSGDQLVAFHKLLVQQIEPAETPHRLPSESFSRAMINIAEPKYQAVLGEKWPAVKIIFERTRKQLAVRD